MLRAWYCVTYYLSWTLFGVGGVVLCLCCLPLLPWAGRRGLARWLRRIIRGLFGVYMGWFGATGVVRLRWLGFPQKLPGGRIYIANHPCLLDATFLLSRIPDAVCVLKPALLANPAMGAAARAASYEPGDNMIDLAHRLEPQLAAGSSLLVFSEGTRTTPGEVMGKFRPGFALLALRARVPVQVIYLRCREGCAPKGRPWWRFPKTVPFWVDLEYGPEFQPQAYASAGDLAQAVEQTMRAHLEQGSCPTLGACREPAGRLPSLA